MGNCFKRCVGDDSASDQDYVSYGRRPTPHQQPSTFTYNVVGFTAVARDLLEFEATHKVSANLFPSLSELRTVT